MGVNLRRGTTKALRSPRLYEFVAHGRKRRAAGGLVHGQILDPGSVASLAAALCFGFVAATIFHADGMARLGWLLALLVDTHGARKKTGVRTDLLGRGQPCRQWIGLWRRGWRRSGDWLLANNNRRRGRFGGHSFGWTTWSPGLRGDDKRRHWHRHGHCRCLAPPGRARHRGNCHIRNGNDGVARPCVCRR